MTIVAGVDGCRGGWIMVRREGRRAPTVHIAERWADLHDAADMIAVDMPIGLPETGARGCDLDARRLLGPKRSSVFTGLRRPLLGFGDYPAANAWGKSDGAGLSKQAWFLLPKIREIDEAIAPADQARVRETHPELAFMGLAGEPVMDRKRTPDGEGRRIALLRAAGLDVLPLLAGLDRRRARADDLIDAAVLSLVAARMVRGTARCLTSCEPRMDSRGLRMEIWY